MRSTRWPKTMACSSPPVARGYRAPLDRPSAHGYPRLLRASGHVADPVRRLRTCGSDRRLTSNTWRGAWNWRGRRWRTATSRSVPSWSTPTAKTLFEDRNRVKDGDATRHPEFAIARWAAENMAPVRRVRATVYTSGEHCPMCAAAHAWVGLGRIVYATSGQQLSRWREEWGPAAVAGGGAADHHRRTTGGRRRAGAAVRGRDEGTLRGKVPAVTEPGWVQHAIWWHIYPLGIRRRVPAPKARPWPTEHRLRRVTEWLDHVVTLGASGIALGPVFASRTHGYDTTDHYRIDPAPRRRRRLRRPGRPGARARAAGAARRRVQPRRNRLRAVPRRTRRRC